MRSFYKGHCETFTSLMSLSKTISADLVHVLGATSAWCQVTPAAGMYLHGACWKTSVATRHGITA